MRRGVRTDGEILVMKGLKTAGPRDSVPGRKKREAGGATQLVEAEEAVALTERWKQSLEDGPRRSCNRGKGNKRRKRRGVHR